MKKGYMTTGILYTMLLLFLALLFGTLNDLSNKKRVLDGLKLDTVNALNCNNGFDCSLIGSTDISMIGDGTVTGAISDIYNKMDRYEGFGDDYFGWSSSIGNNTSVTAGVPVEIMKVLSTENVQTASFCDYATTGITIKEDGLYFVEIILGTRSTNLQLYREVLVNEKFIRIGVSSGASSVQGSGMTIPLKEGDVIKPITRIYGSSPGFYYGALHDYG